MWRATKNRIHTRAGNTINRTGKSIASFGKGFNKDRPFRGFAKRFAKSLDRSIYAVFKIDKSVRGPKPGAQLFSCYQTSALLQQRGKNLQWLFLQPYLLAVPPQFTRF